MENTGKQHLQALGNSNLKMAAGQPNLATWGIVDHTGQKIGTVYDVLFDEEAKKVRYIITNLNNGELLKQDRLVLMPVGRARYHKSENQVVFPNVTKEQLSSLPDYLTVDRLSREDEFAVRNAFKGKGESLASAGDLGDKSFYDHEDFNEDNFYSGSSSTSGESQKVTSGTVDSKNDTGANSSKDKNTKEVKAGAGTDSLLTETKNQSSGGAQGNQKNEDVNVHPDPAERSGDKSAERTGGTDKEITNAENKDRDTTTGNVGKNS